MKAQIKLERYTAPTMADKWHGFWAGVRATIIELERRELEQNIAAAEARIEQLKAEVEQLETELSHVRD